MGLEGTTCGRGGTIRLEMKYLSNTGHNYGVPTQPPDIDPDMLLPGKTQIQIKIMQSVTIVVRRNYAVVTGFRRGVSKKYLRRT